MRTSHCHLEHTHQVGPAIFAHYPVNRRLTAAEEATISDMLTVKPNTKRVKELVEKKFGKCVTLKDISNLKTKVKEQTQKGLEEPQLLLSTLQNITTTQDAQAGIVVNENRGGREGGERRAAAPVKKHFGGA